MGERVVGSEAIFKQAQLLFGEPQLPSRALRLLSLVCRSHEPLRDLSNWSLLPASYCETEDYVALLLLYHGDAESALSKGEEKRRLGAGDGCKRICRKQ